MTHFIVAIKAGVGKSLNGDDVSEFDHFYIDLYLFRGVDKFAFLFGDDLILFFSWI